MREHMGLFRGKRIDTGDWVEGFYAHFKDLYKDKETHRIYTPFAESDCGEFYPDWYEVDPTTIGECTGLKDKNGKLIFERHVLRYGNNIGYVNYGTGCFCVKSCTPDWRNRNNPAIDIILNEYPYDVEIIGELEDYPELLKGGEG